MKTIIKQTEKILYNGNNHDEIHSHFKKWESEWNFSTKLFTHHHGSYEQALQGNIRADLIIRGVNNNPPQIIPFNRYLSFYKSNDNEILLNIEIIP